MSKDLVIYTAIFGKVRDKLKPPRDVPKSIPCVAFVDKRKAKEAPRLGLWQLRAPYLRQDDPRRQARWHKLHPHLLFPEATYSLWLDGSFTPLCDPWDLVARFLGEHDICLFAHPTRNCVYQELEACVRLRKDSPLVMRKQVDGYRREGYPYHAGLGETGAVLRRHTPAMRELGELWWSQIKHGSCRDQLSFNYSMWKLNLGYATFDGRSSNSSYFEWRPHR